MFVPGPAGDKRTPGLYGFSPDQSGGNLQFQGNASPGFDQLGETADGHLSHIFFGHIDGGEGRFRIGRHGHIVKAHQGHVFGDPEAFFFRAFMAPQAMWSLSAK